MSLIGKSMDLRSRTASRCADGGGTAPRWKRWGSSTGSTASAGGASWSLHTKKRESAAPAAAARGASYLRAPTELEETKTVFDGFCASASSS